MEPADSQGMPDDVLIVEDDAIIALDFEDTVTGFGVRRVRCAGSVARALQLIDDRAPDFALLDVGLVSEKSFAIAERLQAMQIPFLAVLALTPCQWRVSTDWAIAPAPATSRRPVAKRPACTKRRRATAVDVREIGLLLNRTAGSHRAPKLP